MLDIRAAFTSALVTLLLAGCGGSSSSPPDANYGVDVVVSAFAETHVYFGAENRRVVDTTVVFPPAAALYRSISLDFALGCPNNACDYWDRLGWLSIVRNPGSDAEEEIEISRFITPYRVAASWRVDVTDLRLLLTGEVTMRVFIDTWVGPGHAQGEGWLVDASFDFRGGPPPRPVDQVINLWSPHGRVYGDPAQPFAVSTSAAVPADILAARVRTLVTGHGQGSSENCAEFCSKSHSIDVAGTRYDKQIWRDDCPETAVPDQAGTWEYPRAGWCPGAVVREWTVEVTEATVGGGDINFTYDAEAYENSCRPDADPCTGCLAGTCDYDGGAHTEPRYQLSSLLILYR